MPRKVNYGLDYYKDYDDYEDYDYHDQDVDDNAGEASEPKQETNKTGLWCCPICTYDNDEGLSVCDICGIIRNPVAGSHNIDDRKAADGVCKDSGVSRMAKSLFASLPCQTPQKAVVQLRIDDFMTRCDTKFQRHGDFRGNFHDLHKAFVPNSELHIKVDLDMFDNRTYYSRCINNFSSS